VGYPLGRIKIGGSSLGVASVLFTGLAIGSLHPDLKLPEIVYVLGVALFVYTVGLANGPAFLASLKRQGDGQALSSLAGAVEIQNGRFRLHE